MPVLSEGFLDIQAIVECRCTLKLVCDMITTYSRIAQYNKYSQHSSIINVSLAKWLSVHLWTKWFWIIIRLLSLKCKSVGLKHCDYCKAFSEYLNDIHGIYKNISTIQYSPDKKRKILIKFNDVIANMLSNKKRQPVVTELFIRSGKLNISFMLYNLILQYWKLLD